MKHAKRNSFVLLYVILAIGWISTAMYVLADATGTLAFETRKMYLQACSRNLSASAAAWCRTASGDIPAKGEKKLDIADLKIPNATLSVGTIRDKAGNARVKIRTRCRRGRHVVAAVYELVNAGKDIKSVQSGPMPPRSDTCLFSHAVRQEDRNGPTSSTLEPRLSLHAKTD